MTQDEIIEMWKNSGDLEILGMPYSKIEAFAKLVAAKEREACALERQQLIDENTEIYGLLGMAHLNLKQHLEYGFNPKTATSTLISVGRYAPKLREAIAKQEQGEPYGYVDAKGGGLFIYGEHQFQNTKNAELVPVYTTTQQRTWVGLTWNDVPDEWVGKVAFMEGAKWADKQLKEKNT